MTRIDFRGTPAMLLETRGGARAVVALHGAQLLSWTPARGREWIFLSERAELTPGKAIRGGVPICFPQFAALGPLQKHGLVRTRSWRAAGKQHILLRRRFSRRYRASSTFCTLCMPTLDLAKLSIACPHGQTAGRL